MVWILLRKRWSVAHFLDLYSSRRRLHPHCNLICSHISFLVRHEPILAWGLHWLLGWWVHDAEVEHHWLIWRLPWLLHLHLLELTNLFYLNRIVAWTCLFFAGLRLWRGLFSHIHSNVSLLIFMLLLCFFERTHTFTGMRLRLWFVWWSPFIRSLWETRDVPAIGGVVFVDSLSNLVNVILANWSDLALWLFAVVVEASHDFLLVSVLSPDHSVVLPLESTRNCRPGVCHRWLANIILVKSDRRLENHAISLRVQVHVVIYEMWSHQVFFLILHLRLDKQWWMLIFSLVDGPSGRG